MDMHTMRHDELRACTCAISGAALSRAPSPRRPICVLDGRLPGTQRTIQNYTRSNCTASPHVRRCLKLAELAFSWRLITAAHMSIDTSRPAKTVVMLVGPAAASSACSFPLLLSSSLNPAIELLALDIGGATAGGCGAAPQAGGAMAGEPSALDASAVCRHHRLDAIRSNNAPALVHTSKAAPTNEAQATRWRTVWRASSTVSAYGSA